MPSKPRLPTDPVTPASRPAAASRVVGEAGVGAPGSDFRCLAPERPGWRILLLVWLFGVVLPLVVADHALREVMAVEEAGMRSRARTRLLGMMRGATRDLLPEMRLHAAMRAITRGWGWSGLSLPRGHRYYPPADATADAALDPERRLTALLADCRREIGALPILAMTCGPDIDGVAGWAAPQAFGADHRLSRRALQHVLAAYAGLGARRWWRPQARARVEEARRDGTARAERMLASWFDDTGFRRFEAGKIQGIFTTRFGAGQLWLYADFLTASPAPDAPIIAGFLVVFRDADLGWSFIFGPALRARGRTVTRRVQALVPRFLDHPRGYYGFCPLPARLQTRWHERFLPIAGWRCPSAGAGARHAGDRPESGSIGPPAAISAPTSSSAPSAVGAVRLAAAPPVLVIRLDRGQIDHRLRGHWHWLRVLAAVLAVAVAALLAATLRGRASLPLSLRGKLLLAVGLAMVAPLAGCLVLAVGWLDSLLQQADQLAVRQLTAQFEQVDQYFGQRLLEFTNRVRAEREDLRNLDWHDSRRVERQLRRSLERLRVRHLQLLTADGREFYLERDRPGDRPLDATERSRMTEMARVFGVRWLIDAGAVRPSDFGRPGAPPLRSRSRLAVAGAVGVNDAIELLTVDLAVFSAQVFDQMGLRVMRGSIYDRQRPGGRPLGILFIGADLHRLALDAVRELLRANPGLESPWRGYQLRWAFVPVRDPVQLELALDRTVPEVIARDPEFVRAIAEGASECRGGWWYGERAVIRYFEGFGLIAVGLADPTGWRWLQPAEMLVVLISLCSLGVTLLIVAYLAGSFVAPISAAAQAGLAISQGRLDTGLHLATDDEFVELAAEFNAMTRGLRERLRLTRFVSSGVVEAVRQGRMTGAGQVGERREVTVMFTHLADFASWVSSRAPAWIVTLLNRYFPLVEAEVVREGGTIDKYIGDAAMAVFSGDDSAGGDGMAGGAVDPPGRRAMRAALSLRRAAVTMTPDRAPSATGETSLRVSIGIATGVAIVGDIGSRLGRLDHTVIGHPVNLAARLETESRRRPGNPVIVDEATARHLGPDLGGLDDGGEVPVKGVARPVRIFALRAREQA